MSVRKSWAYVSEFGRERITAWAISRERAKYDGKPLGQTYWSTHKPGRRKPVKHVQKGATAYFAYINPADAVDGGDGESLSHRLLKEAIAGLSGTTLRLGNQGEHDITITHGETEKLIPTVEGTYYADAYLRFTSNTLLGLRWSEELYVEVHHTHAVPVDKQKELRRSRVPVVEVPLLDAFKYPHEDENTSDPREAAHLERIRNMLEKGFLAGQVISDRRSVEFLEQEVTRLAASLREARSGWEADKKSAAQTADQLALARARAAGLEKSRAEDAREIERCADRLGELQQAFDAEKKKASVLSGELGKAKATIAGQRKKVRRYWIAGGAAIVLSMGGALGYLQFLKAPSVAQDLSAQPAAVSPPVTQSAETRAATVSARHAVRTTMAHRHHAPTPAPVADDSESVTTAQ
jgi:hypothetical protein